MNRRSAIPMLPVGRVGVLGKDLQTAFAPAAQVNVFRCLNDQFLNRQNILGHRLFRYFHYVPMVREQNDLRLFR